MRIIWGDGILIGAAVLVDVSLGVATAVAVAAHGIPQERWRDRASSISLSLTCCPVFIATPTRRPGEFVSGNAMAFVGVARAADRAALIGVS